MSIRRSVILASGLCVLGSITSLALADGAPAGVPRREAAAQVVKCMKKRMAADRYLSYNQATRDCRAFVMGNGHGAGGGGELLAADRVKAQ